MHELSAIIFGPEGTLCPPVGLGLSCFVSRCSQGWINQSLGRRVANDRIRLPWGKSHKDHIHIQDVLARFCTSSSQCTAQILFKCRVFLASYAIKRKILLTSTQVFCKPVQDIIKTGRAQCLASRLLWRTSFLKWSAVASADHCEHLA